VVPEAELKPTEAGLVPASVGLVRHERATPDDSIDPDATVCR